MNAHDPDLLTIDRLSKSFSISSGLFSRPFTLHALQDISFSVRKGETLGIVGESGCGKSTLGRCILQLLSPDEGRVLWLGEDITKLPGEAMRQRRRDLQIIFQDPLASLNPRLTVGEIIADPLRELMPELKAEERRKRVISTMEAVGLLPEMINRYPHEFSGGQAQRIGIARALITGPKLIVCDEPVSALDVSIQAQIVNLLRDLQQRLGLTMLFISHDLAVVEYICDTVIVLYLGRIMEIAPSEALYTNPRHPYTRALLSAIPSPVPGKARQRQLLTGDIPSPANPPSGCVFRTRCPHAIAACATAVPPMEEVAPGHFKACIRNDVSG